MTVEELAAKVLERLEHVPCGFWACPGPDVEPEDMATCHACWLIWDLTHNLDTFSAAQMTTDPLRDLAVSNLPVPYHPSVSPAERESLVMAVLSLHRRALNCRACTGCDWEPEHPGGTSNAEATRRRNTDFNTHLAHLIVTELA